MRKIIGLVTAAALLAAGCGTTEDPAAEGSQNTGEKITLTDSRGKEVTLDGPAERIAVTEWNAVEYVVSLGLTPTAVSDIEGYQAWSSAEPLPDGVTDLGTRGEPSTDTLGSLNLDLVIVTDELIEGALEQIEEDIPVIVVMGGNREDSLGEMWKNIELVAKATGTEDKVAGLRSDWDAKVEEGKAAVEAAGATGEKVAFSDAYVDAGTVNVRPFAKGSQVSDVLEAIGLTNAWPMEGDEAYGLASADVEGLTVLGDVRFWYVANDAFGDPYTQELANNAIWTNLPFVKSGKVHRFPDSIWMFGGPTSMAQYVDAAVEALG